MSEERIKIAIQKSGRLTEHTISLLQKCGLIFSHTQDQLIGYGENMPFDLMFVRDDDIPDLEDPADEDMPELDFSIAPAA